MDIAALRPTGSQGVAVESLVACHAVCGAFSDPKDASSATTHLIVRSSVYPVTVYPRKTVINQACVNLVAVGREYVEGERAIRVCWRGSNLMIGGIAQGILSDLPLTWIFSVRPNGAVHQWRKDPPRELSVGPGS